MIKQFRVSRERLRHIRASYDALRRTPKCSGAMRTPNIVDARKLYNPENFKNTNFVAMGSGPFMEGKT